MSVTWPSPAAVDLARSIVYLDGTGVGGNLLVIALWGLVGLALNLLLVDRWLNRPGARPHAPMGPRYRPERGKSADPDGGLPGTAPPAGRLSDHDRIGVTTDSSDVRSNSPGPLAAVAMTIVSAPPRKDPPHGH